MQERFDGQSGNHEQPVQQNFPLEVFLKAYSFVYFRGWKVSRDSRRFFYDEVVPSALYGNKRSLAYDAEVLLKPYQKEICGRENIPAVGPLVVVANHYGEGPLHYYWTHFLIAQTVASAREGNQGVSFVMQDSLILPVVRKPMLFSKDITRLLTDMYGLHTVSPPNVRLKSGELLEFGRVASIVRSYVRGGVIGLYPELKNSKRITFGHPLAGALVACLARRKPEGWICPIGLSIEKNGGHEILSMNVGEAMRAGEVIQNIDRDGSKEEVYQEIANRLMVKINQLVPEKNRNPQLA